MNIRHPFLGGLLAVIVLVLLEIVPALVVTAAFVDTGSGQPELPAMTRLGDLQGTFSDMDGRATPFADLRGKVVVVNLWATWCPPCRAEMPYLRNLWKKFEGNDGLRVLCISTESADEVRAHPLSAELDMPLYVFDPPAPPELQAEGLPTTYIFDRRGRVVFGHTGMARWDADEIVAYLEGLLGTEAD
jgi:thiol-disulfide isomerase/thioredoxin